MITAPPCPICQSHHWRSLQKFTFRTESLYRPAKSSSLRKYKNQLRTAFNLIFSGENKPIQLTANDLTPAQRLRWRVLFEKWFPDVDTVELTSQVCLNCGFMTYSPRPTEEDLRAKYAFLTSRPEERRESPSGIQFERKETQRMQRIYKRVAGRIDNSSRSILDYGGGDGKLLAPFLQNGFAGFLVDYEPNPLPGIIKLGDELDDMPPDQQFDVILCNHVLEHLADPVDTVRRLRKHLKPGGVLYAEVPMETRGGIQLSYDPVTHINFFTQNSFELMFERSGYRILEAHTQVGSYASANKEVIWLTAMSQLENDRVQPRPPITDVDELLHPGIRRNIERFLRLYVRSD